MIFNFDQDAGATKAAQDLQLQSLFQRWNQTTQKLEPDQSKPGLKAEEALSALQELGKLCRDNVLTKFNAIRRLNKEPEENEKAVFVAEVARRGQGTGAVGQANKQRSLESGGCAAAPAHAGATRPGRCSAESVGGREHGPLREGLCAKQAGLQRT